MTYRKPLSFGRLLYAALTPLAILLLVPVLLALLVTGRRADLSL